jgi:thiamine biosynthesis lipoprotein
VHVRLLLTIFGAFWTLASVARADEPVHIYGPTMGSAWSIKLAGAPPGFDAAKLRSEVEAFLRQLDERISTYSDDSEVARFNASRETDWFAVSEETARLLAVSLQMAERSGGTFDPTVAPLTRLWKFDRHEGRTSLPADAEIEAARQRVDYRRLQVRLDPPGLRKLVPDLELNLNAIAPGWAVDRLVERLQAQGLSHHLVDVGSEIRTGGRKADGSSWQIGIERPVDTQHVLQAALPLDDRAVATSGDYRNFYVIDGRRYSHTIDPRTGRPVQHGLASVTVLADDCATADALATAISVLGPSAGMEFAEREGLAVWMMVRDEQGELRERASTQFSAGVGRHLVDFVAESVDPVRTTSPESGTAVIAESRPPAASPWLLPLITLGVFVLASVGLGLGWLVRGKSLSGSCGGLAGIKDEHGRPLCSSCSIPPEQCAEFQQGVRSTAASRSGEQP